MATDFIRDVFEYLRSRGTVHEPGPIPRAIIATLREARSLQQQRLGEPLVVITHSMGGQIVYDLVSSILPAAGENDLRIDFWCATASQVGLFEELKLFIGSSEEYSRASKRLVPPPPKSVLGRWWNVWDFNDFLSFTAKGIFNGVTDDDYSSGMSLVGAHGGYLQRPSFFRELASRLRDAEAAGWDR